MIENQLNLLSEAKAAQLLGLNRTTLLRHRQQGAISHYRLGKRVLYSQTQLQDFLSAMEQKSVNYKEGLVNE